MSLASSASKVGGKIGNALKSVYSSKGGKAVVTGAGIGGGSYLALSGAGAGIENILEGTGIGSIIKSVNPDVTDSGSRGWGSLIGIGLLIGIALLVVFIVIPKAHKNRGSGNHA